MPETYIARAKSVAARGLGDEMMIMSVADSTVFALDEIGTILWKSADGITPLAQIVRDSVCSTYDVEPETALEDAEEFCKNLAASGVLVTSDQPIVSGGSR